MTHAERMALGRIVARVVDRDSTISLILATMDAPSMGYHSPDAELEQQYNHRVYAICHTLARKLDLPTSLVLATMEDYTHCINGPRRN